MTNKHMYQHPLVQDLKGYFITKQLAYVHKCQKWSCEEAFNIHLCVFNNNHMLYTYMEPRRSVPRTMAEVVRHGRQQQCHKPVRFIASWQSFHYLWNGPWK